MCLCPHHKTIMHVMRLADARAFAPEEFAPEEHAIHGSEESTAVLPENNALMISKAAINSKGTSPMATIC